jgi:type IX secretion system PorP/SprF family membrane protein
MRTYITTILLFVSVIVVGQQLPQSTFFNYDHMTINPGYAGTQEGVCINVLARNQWMGFEGAPATQKFDVHTPFKLFGLEHGVGLALFNDKYGFANDISSTLSYAFLKNIGFGKLGVGVGFGLNNQKLEGEWEPPQIGQDNLIPTASAKGKLAFSFNVGAFYKTSNVFLGLSVMNVNAGDMSYKDNTGVTKYSYLVRHYNITAGYNYQRSNPLFEIEPAVLISTIGSSTRININGTLRYRDKVWGGVGYRNTDAITTFIGAEFLEGLLFGVAYDITTSKIAKFDDGSVEIFLRYVFKIGIEKDHSNYKSIRFL